MSSPHGSSWTWPQADADATPDEQYQNIPLVAPGNFPDEEPVRPAPKQEEQETAQPGSPPKGNKKKYYAPRTCRICLEVVQPTFEPVVDGFASILNPTPKVSYISEDPESGRLIRPCKCKGSQRYCHEGCLQQWRHADPSYGRRNFWECPTCKFRYRLERLRWSRWMSSAVLQIVITFGILFTTVFVLGFVADPIINLYLDPYDTITSIPLGGTAAPLYEDEDEGWIEHFLKGLASLGLLGFVKVFFAMSPWHWLNIRQTGIGRGGGRTRGGTGRERLENISWSLVIIGVVTFLYAVWKWVRAWTRRTLEKAGERVADVQGDDDDDEEEESPAGSQPSPDNRKTQ
ncbi:hypothetical protein BP6252_03226 [Coleophoma cylindrospora]|uniref:RING-CH-type domain-containing protein n=1 Tax=Coleophoma cylindrospora TaxID=1849047 RepID=A0A3D8S7S2_9HELO|nr:hypothetical protein BP6252_03226 [Coleophoma cylindrospora]